MKIAIITGSHRPYSNSSALAGEFRRGAEEAGHAVYVFDAAHKQVRPCIGCDSCHMDGPCVFHDAMDELAPKLIAADAVVFATPLYYFGFSAQIKAVIDRFYFFNGKISTPKSAYLLAAMCGEEARASQGLERQYELIVEFLNWQDKGKLIAAGLCPQRAVQGTDWLRKAYEMGKNIG